MNISWDQTGGILRRMNSAGMLKSTQDRLERQEETKKQVDFFEKQKENLKNVSCGSVEEIAEKLKMFQSYEDQIAAVKAAYNQEQMFHIMDESTERGEKIAEAVEKMEPKTPEERLEELVEEALGIEESGGELEEIMDELEEVEEELEAAEEMTEETAEAAQEVMEEAAGELAEGDVQTADRETVEDGEVVIENVAASSSEILAENWKLPEDYVPFDIKL